MDILWRTIRKLSNENVMTVIKALCNGGKTFAEIQMSTGLIVNDLNHALYDMKQINLVIMEGEKKGERKYHLTGYCIVLLKAIDRVQD